MNGKRKIIISLGIVAFVIILLPWSRQSNDEAREAQAPVLVEEAQKLESGEEMPEAVEPIEQEAVVGQSTEGIETVDPMSQDQSQKQAMEEKESEEDKSPKGVPERPEVISESLFVEAETVESPVEPAVVQVVDQADQTDNTGPTEDQSLSERAVDEMEDSLSASDYAKGLRLLAQLPVETIDRFVELRKDGFTGEEQAEVKAILLASYQGEDLEWIVEVYHKLQP